MHSCAAALMGDAPSARCLPPPISPTEFGYISRLIVRDVKSICHEKKETAKKAMKKLKNAFRGANTATAAKPASKSIEEAGHGNMAAPPATPPRTPNKLRKSMSSRQSRKAEMDQHEPRASMAEFFKVFAPAQQDLGPRTSIALSSSLPQSPSPSPPRPTPRLRRKKSTHMLRASIGTQDTHIHSIFSERPSTASSNATAYDEDDINEDLRLFPDEAIAAKPPATPFAYDLLSNHLKIWYQKRPFGLADHSERWRNRATYLMLQQALDASCINSYDGFKPGSFAEQQFLSRVQDIASRVGNRTFLLALGGDIDIDNDSKLSRVPNRPYTAATVDTVRIDSAHSACDQPMRFWPFNRSAKGKEKKTAPKPEEIYFAVLVAATDRAASYAVVEALLQEVRPELDVEHFLTCIGDPAWRWSEAERRELWDGLVGLIGDGQAHGAEGTMVGKGKKEKDEELVDWISTVQHGSGVRIESEVPSEARRTSRTKWSIWKVSASAQALWKA